MVITNKILTSSSTTFNSDNQNATIIYQARKIVNLLREIPDRTHHNIVDVEMALGKIRWLKDNDFYWFLQFMCSIYGQGFEQKCNFCKDLFDLIKSLPFRTYRDSAEVAIDLMIPLPL